MVRTNGNSGNSFVCNSYMNRKIRQFIVEGKSEIGKQTPLINQELKYQLLKTIFKKKKI